MSKIEALPIIHIIGLPGAGKTTLAKKLSRKFKIPIYRIGEYRCKFPITPTGEADAWISLFRAMSRQNWGNCLIETTGLNRRESFLSEVLPLERLITIKLEAQRKILYTRISQKKKREQGGAWLFSEIYPDKYEFVKKLFKSFSCVPAEIKINTTKLTSCQVYKAVIEQLGFYLN
ncbi:MAG: hypothetical protein KAX15_01170 [Candidatus Omnitrophica bacterium]|nr:hypothetical protein [Candidatus Omnitrophota bacterium]